MSRIKFLERNRVSRTESSFSNGIEFLNRTQATGTIITNSEEMGLLSRGSFNAPRPRLIARGELGVGVLYTKAISG